VIVIDASVAAMWFLDEADSDNARQLLVRSHDLVAPDLLRLEVASVLLRAIRRKDLGLRDCEQALATVLPGAIRVVPAEGYATDALRLASRHGGALDDAIYVALAQAIRAPLITGDEAQAAIARAARHKVLMIGDGLPPKSA
jgi:predicted nucleic acid-binding protein